MIISENQDIVNPVFTLETNVLKNATVKCVFRRCLCVWNEEKCLKYHLILYAEQSVFCLWKINKWTIISKKSTWPALMTSLVVNSLRHSQRPLRLLWGNKRLEDCGLPVIISMNQNFTRNQIKVTLDNSVFIFSYTPPPPFLINRKRGFCHHFRNQDRLEIIHLMGTLRGPINAFSSLDYTTLRTTLKKNPQCNTLVDCWWIETQSWDHKDFLELPPPPLSF